MVKFSPTSQDLINLEKRWHEIFKRVGNGTLDPRGAYDALQPIVEGKFPLVSEPFGSYVKSNIKYGNKEATDKEIAKVANIAGMLLSLDQQLALLREYNETYWNGAIPEDMFAAIDTTSDHVQRVDDLEILYVQFGSDKETFQNWVAVIKGEQPNFWCDGILTKGYDIRRIATSTRQYPFGIFRVHINLVAHWELKNRRSVDKVREQVKGMPERLAHAEVFAAYALHTELFQATDGINLPSFEAAGYRVKASRDRYWGGAPYANWSAHDRRAYVGCGGIGFRGCTVAAPVVWES